MLVCFLVQMKTLKSPFEIKSPLKEIGPLSKETGSESTATKTNRFYF